eukprot:2786412-Prymnesium_polylepis.1
MSQLIGHGFCQLRHCVSKLYQHTSLNSSKCNEFATRFRIRFAAASRLSRAVSRLVSRVSHR